MNSKLKLYFEILITYMKIGAFTFGGGNAMIPIVQHEIVDNKKWISDEQMNDYITLAQSTPGITGINMATAVGNKIAGTAGGFFASLGLAAPSLLIIIVLASVIDNLKNFEIIQHAFMGVRASVVALILFVVIRLYKNSVKEFFQLIIFIFSTFLVVFVDLPAVYIIIGSGVFAYIYSMLLERSKKWK